MHIIENLIRGIEDSYRSYTLNTFRRCGYDQLVGLIIVTIHRGYVTDDGDSSSLIVTPRFSNAELTLQECVCVLIIDGHQII